jgi:hypothetical protein
MVWVVVWGPFCPGSLFVRLPVSCCCGEIGWFCQVVVRPCPGLVRCFLRRNEIISMWIFSRGACNLLANGKAECWPLDSRVSIVASVLNASKSLSGLAHQSPSTSTQRAGPGHGQCFFLDRPRARASPCCKARAWWAWQRHRAAMTLCAHEAARSRRSWQTSTHGTVAAITFIGAEPLGSLTQKL